MKNLSFYPKHPVIRNTLDQLMMAHGPNGCGLRVSTETAFKLRAQKPILELIRADKIDIVSRQNGPRRSIIYLPPDVKIKKKGEKYHFLY